MLKKNIKRIIFYILLIAVTASVYLSQKTALRTYSATYTEYLDTVCEITIVSNSEKPLLLCEEYLKFADQEFSSQDSNSTLFKINENDEIATDVPADLQELITIGSDYTNKHTEYFSIKLDKIIKLWDISNNPNKIPEKSEIDNALKDPDYNLGGIAKGYISDKIKEILVENGVESALINLGGNTYALGKKTTGENYRIGIQNPSDENSIIGSVSAENLAVVTSGDYQRYTIIDKKRYHHIFNPITGYPADNGLHSVTVICDSATDADFLSTAAFVAGVDEGHKLLKSYGALGIFITDDTVYFSKDLENNFVQMDFSYNYEFLY